MLCEHLSKLENELSNNRIKETYRGMPWSNNCREWVYYDCFLNLHELRQRLQLDNCVVDHEHLGTHDGQEAGFVCSIHHDAIMGVHKEYAEGKVVIK